MQAIVTGALVMPRPAVDLTPFRGEIELKIAAGDTLDSIRDWLADQGISIGHSALRRRTKEWGATRRAAPPTPALIDAIQQLYHTTRDNDCEIATSLTAEGTLRLKTK